MKDATSPHFERGSHDSVAVVLSCPGRHEELQGKPAAGTTGTNLEILLEALSKLLLRQDLYRGAITITNAWPFVEYKEATGRSEATFSEVKQAKNVARLEAELAHVKEFVIFCGDRARSVYPLLGPGVRRVETCHPGGRGLCASVRLDVDGRPIVAGRAGNTRRRLEVIAGRIGQELRSPASAIITAAG